MGPRASPFQRPPQRSCSLNCRVASVVELFFCRGFLILSILERCRALWGNSRSKTIGYGSLRASLTGRRQQSSSGNRWWSVWMEVVLKLCACASRRLFQLLPMICCLCPELRLDARITTVLAVCTLFLSVSLCVRNSILNSYRIGAQLESSRFFFQFFLYAHLEIQAYRRLCNSTLADLMTCM